MFSMVLVMLLSVTKSGGWLGSGRLVAIAVFAVADFGFAFALVAFFAGAFFAVGFLVAVFFAAGFGFVFAMILLLLPLLRLIYF
jgi:hypothetical protein